MPSVFKTLPVTSYRTFGPERCCRHGYKSVQIPHVLRCTIPAPRSHDHFLATPNFISRFLGLYHASGLSGRSGLPRINGRFGIRSLACRRFVDRMADCSLCGQKLSDSPCISDPAGAGASSRSGLASNRGSAPRHPRKSLSCFLSSKSKLSRQAAQIRAAHPSNAPHPHGLLAGPCGIFRMQP